MLTKLDRLQGYSARETCVALLSMLAILLFAPAIAVAQTNIVVSQQLWGANETNSAATFENEACCNQWVMGNRRQRRLFATESSAL